MSTQNDRRPYLRFSGKMLSTFNFAPYCDVAGNLSHNLPILDCLKGFEKTTELGFFKFDELDIKGFKEEKIRIEQQKTSKRLHAFLRRNFLYSKNCLRLGDSNYIVNYEFRSYTTAIMIVTMTNRFTDIVITVKHTRVGIIFSVIRANQKKKTRSRDSRICFIFQ